MTGQVEPRLSALHCCRLRHGPAHVGRVPLPVPADCHLAAGAESCTSAVGRRGAGVPAGGARSLPTADGALWLLRLRGQSGRGEGGCGRVLFMPGTRIQRGPSLTVGPLNSGNKTVGDTFRPEKDP